MTATKTRYVEVTSGVELYVEETGEGRPLVFIPGWTMSTEVFARQVPHFSDHYRVVTYDPRCQGRSTKTIEGISYPQHGRDLGTLLDRLNLEQSVLLPSSYGCLKVWEMVRQRGLGDVAGIVCIDQPPQQQMRSPGDWVDSDMEGFVEVLRSLVDSPDTYFRGLSRYLWQRTPPVSELDWFVAQSQRTPTYATRLMVADAYTREETDIAEAIDGTIPVLHVVSEDVAKVARLWLARHCPAARVESLGAHFMFWEHSGRFNALVDAFLRDHRL